MFVLHVTNGDHAASGLARSGLPGDILSWRDLLHDGPVLPTGDADGFRRARGAFIASLGGADNADAIAQDFAERDARLLTPGHADEIVLWFEPDLYDQLQLIQILAMLAQRSSAERPSVTIVPADCFLGPLHHEKFAPLYHARRRINEADLAHGEAAWRAFTSPAPDPLLEVAERLDRDVRARTYDARTDVRLPHLAAALRRQLEEYPDLEHGLSRSERQICEALAPGEMPLSKLFLAAHHSSESWAWLGDSTFAWYVQRLSDCPRPLVMHPNGTRVLAPTRDGKGFWERNVVLTPFGQEVVRGRADAVLANGIDRWIGGVHLTATHLWRWDGRFQRTVEKRDGSGNT